MRTFSCGLPASHCATRVALRAACFMRSTTVSIERVIIQHECGSSCEPKALRMARTFLIRSFEPVTAPATRSLWPPTYLVSEYTHRSTPCSAGFWKIGPSSVLSHTEIGR